MGNWDATDRPLSPIGPRALAKAKGKPHPMRTDVTKDPTVLAEAGWDNEPADMIWTAIDAMKFVKWYHIDKVFPEFRKPLHHKQGVALNRTCTDPHFKHRLLEVI